MSSENKSQNKNFIIGVVAGAAVAYVLSNKKLTGLLSSKVGEGVSSANGELEEIKEKLEDTQAELEYYRNLNK